jgi:hypothetical protein
VRRGKREEGRGKREENGFMITSLGRASSFKFGLSGFCWDSEWVSVEDIGGEGVLWICVFGVDVVMDYA